MTHDPDVGLGPQSRAVLDEVSPAEFKAQLDDALKRASVAPRQASPTSTQKESQNPGGRQPPSPPPPTLPPSRSRRSGAWTFVAVVLAIFGTFAALAGGFIYGERYGRHHAQYDNPALRQHYAGECYRYMNQQFTKTVRETLDRELQRTDQRPNAQGSGESMALREMLSEMQADLHSLQAALKGTGGSGGDQVNVIRDVRRLIQMLEQNQIQLVADQCPASPSVPRRISGRAG